MSLVKNIASLFKVENDLFHILRKLKILAQGKNLGAIAKPLKIEGCDIFRKEYKDQRTGQKKLYYSSILE